MQKKNLTIATAVVSAAMIVGVLATINHNNILTAFAANQTNEYGCAGNCTGEYYPSHLKEILSADQSLSGSKNVRIKCEYVKDVYFKDVGAILTCQPSSDSDVMALEIPFTWWNETNTDLRGLIHEGDTVCLFGTVSYEFYGVRRIIIRDPVIYAVNDTINTSLLPPVNYLQ